MPKWYNDNGLFEDLPNAGCGPFPFTATLDLTSNRHNLPVAHGCTIQALRGTASNREVTGLLATPQTDGTMVRLANVGATKIKLKSDDNASTAANRMLLDGDMDLKPGMILMLIYNITISRWMRVI